MYAFLSWKWMNMGFATRLLILYQTETNFEFSTTFVGQQIQLLILQRDSAKFPQNQIAGVDVFIGQNNRIRQFVGLDIVVCEEPFLPGNVQSV